MARTELPRIIRLLVVSDAAPVNNAVERLCTNFSEDRYIVRRATRPNDVTADGDRDTFDAVLLDLQPLFDAGMTKAEGVVASMAALGPVIALTGTLDSGTEQSLKRAGAADCLFDDETTPRSLRRAIRHVIA